MLLQLDPMTRLCVPIFVTEFDAARRDVALAAEAGADVVELRIDRLDWVADDGSKANEPLVRQVMALIKQSPVACILTLRAAAEGGFCDLPDQARRDILHDLADGVAAYVD